MKSIITAICLLALCATPSYARHHATFKCGITQANFFGLDPSKFALALNWASLPRTSLHPGAVVVSRRHGRAQGGGPGGHVVRVVTVIDQCHAVVADEKGQYERDICKAQVAIVQPNGGF